MKKYLPSKKFIYTILSIIIALGIVWLFSYLKDLKKDQPNEIVPVENTLSTIQKEFLVLDTDGDGLKDWEEALWKTDPKNTDTDGDSTADFEEIKINRDPLKANTAKAGAEPNDKVSEEVIREDKKMVEDFQKLSDTEKVSRTIFSEFLAIKKADRDLTENEIQYIIENALSNTSEIVFKQYQTKDLNLTSSNTNSELETYANGVLTIFQNHEQIPINPYIVFRSMAENDTDSQIKVKFQVLEPLITAWDKTSQKLLALKVPSSLMIKHLDLVNAFTRVTDNLRQIVDSTNDPIKMLNLINMYAESIINLEKIAYNLFI